MIRAVRIADATGLHAQNQNIFTAQIDTLRRARNIVAAIQNNLHHRTQTVGDVQVNIAVEIFTFDIDENIALFAGENIKVRRAARVADVARCDASHEFVICDGCRKLNVGRLRRNFDDEREREHSDEREMRAGARNLQA